MNYIKIASCTLLLAAVGYFAMQSYKRSDIGKRIETLHGKGDKEETTTEIASPNDALIWLENNLKTTVEGFEHQKPITTVKLANEGKIFARNNDNTIKLDEASQIYNIENPKAPDAFGLYKKIENTIGTFITDLQNKLDLPTNKAYRNYFKTLNIQTGFLNIPDSLKNLLEKLKTAEGFCKITQQQIKAAIGVKVLSSEEPNVQEISNLTDTTRKRVQDFAKNYFNYIIPS